MTADRLAQALSGLLDDTQHAEHDCGDDQCPVREAREALAAYRSQAPAEAHGLPPLPDPKWIYHASDVPGEDDLFLFAESGDVGCEQCERLYTADQMRAYARTAANVQPKGTGARALAARACTAMWRHMPGVTPAQMERAQAELETMLAAEVASTKVSETLDDLRQENERLHRANTALLDAKHQAEQRERETFEQAQAALARTQSPAVTHGAPEPIRCPERVKNGGTCPHHNLQCGWPACNKEKA